MEVSRRNLCAISFSVYFIEIILFFCVLHFSPYSSAIEGIEVLFLFAIIGLIYHLGLLRQLGIS